jgi:hypothetical protein
MRHRWDDSTTRTSEEVDLMVHSIAGRIENRVIDVTAMAPQAFNATATEALRISYRPIRITTLFIGESAPASGKFFYDGDNSMVRYMARALSVPEDQLLERFKTNGRYRRSCALPDQSNDPSRTARGVGCFGAQLKDRIARYRRLQSTHLKSMKSVVEDATAGSGHTCSVYAVSFPGMGQQARFQTEMVELLPGLPRL